MELDHIAIAARTLDEGAAYIRDKLGVEVSLGGEHPAMGTHNHLMRLGDSVYLEIIAIAPHLNAPNRPRWFALDSADMRQQLSERPRLITWIVRCDDIVRRSAQSSVPVGDVIPMSRGALNWDITIGPDGRLPLDGLFPTLIQWPQGPHLTCNMVDLGCHLKGLTLHHQDPDTLRTDLATIGADNLVDIVRTGQTAFLSAKIETPNGLVELD